MRRLRRSAALRSMVRETRVAREALVMPLFVAEGIDRPAEIRSMPGIYRHPVRAAADEGRRLAGSGVPAVLLFGIPEDKTPDGSGAWLAEGVVQRAVQAIKRAEPGLCVVADVCLCEYTTHGHCGLVRGDTVDNDPTLELLARTAVSLARSGADVIAPSDMMDGRVAAIRTALDAAGFSELPILAYSAKYASAFYGPFRDAADSAPRFGDRKAYQMDPANAREALREVELDIDEGADMVMVKPAMPCLDILRRVRDRFDVPVAAYQVSGEYAMVKAAAANGWLDEKRIVIESLTAIKRAGADIIISYFADGAVRWLEEAP
jgi:porphobilinogen synthase